MKRIDLLFLAFEIGLAAWMLFYDYRDPVDAVAREFVTILGGFAGAYAWLRQLVGK